METRGSAFVKGGLGCLGLFLAVGLIVLVAGGHVHINVGGAICLFVVGGAIGLGVFFVWRKGYRAGKGEARKDDIDAAGGPGDQAGA
jgi:hypothetical protein